MSVDVSRKKREMILSLQADETLYQLLKRQHPVPKIGLSFFDSINRGTGIRFGEFVSISGPPACGKTEVFFFISFFRNQNFKILLNVLAVILTAPSHADGPVAILFDLGHF